MDNEKIKKNKLNNEKNKRGFSSLIIIKISLSILKPSLYVFSLLNDPGGRALYLQLNSPTLVFCSRA